MKNPMNQAATVYGVALEPGERVVYFHRDDPGWQKPVLIVLGILTLFAIIGIFLLAPGIVPLLDRFLADRNALEQSPSLPFDALAGPKQKA